MSKCTLKENSYKILGKLGLRYPHKFLKTLISCHPVLVLKCTLTQSINKENCLTINSKKYSAEGTFFDWVRE